MESVESNFWLRRGFSAPRGSDVLLRIGMDSCWIFFSDVEDKAVHVL